MQSKEKRPPNTLGFTCGVATLLLLGALALGNWWLTDATEKWNRPIPIPQGTSAAQVWNIGGPIAKVEFDPIGNVVVILRANGTLEIRESLDGKVLLSVVASGQGSAYSGEVKRGTLAFSPDGQSLATAMSYISEVNYKQAGKAFGMWHTDLTLWEIHRTEGNHSDLYSITQTLTLTHTTFPAHYTVKDQEAVPTSLAFSPDGSILAVGNLDGSVTLWDTSTGFLLGQLPTSASYFGLYYEIKGMMWTLDGKTLITGDYDEDVRKWQIPEGKLTYSQSHSDTHPRGHSTYVFSYDFSPDRQYEATASWGYEIALWQVSDESLLRTIGSAEGPAHLSTIWSTAFSPNSKLIASGGGLKDCADDSGCSSDDPSVRIWSVKDGEQLAQYSGHTDKVTTIAWSPDGHLVASGSEDGTVRLWDTSSIH